MRYIIWILLIFSGTLSYGQKHLYWTSRSGSHISRVNISTKFVENLIFSKSKGSIRQVESIYLDSISRKIFWTEWSGLFVADFNGENERKIIETGDEYTDGIVLDPINSEIWWTQRSRSPGKIFRFDIERNLVDTILFGSTERNPPCYEGLEIDLINQKIFWCEWDTDSLGRIMYSNYDGTNPVVLISNGRPNHLVFDNKNQVLYYSDQLYKNIYRVNLTSNEIDSVFSQPLDEPPIAFEVDFEENVIYWSEYLDGGLGTIKSYSEDSRSLEIILPPEKGLINDIEIIDITNIPNSRVPKRLVTYPNPTTGYVKFKNNKENLRLGIFNIFGHLVMTIELNEKIGDLDLSHLPSGLYFMVCEGTGVLLEKVVVIR